jgi:hypothetical protein
MDRPLKEERLPSMKLSLSLTTVEVRTEEDLETDAAGNVTNEKLLNLYEKRNDLSRLTCKHSVPILHVIWHREIPCGNNSP